MACFLVPTAEAIVTTVIAKAADKDEKKDLTDLSADAAEVVEEKQECPMHALKDAFANWETMEEAAKTELIGKAKTTFAEMDAAMEAKKAEMEAAGEEVCKEMAEMTEEQKKECEAKCAEMKAAWEKFDELTLDEQKDLIMKRLEGCGGEEKGCCKHDAPAETPAETPAE